MHAWEAIDDSLDYIEEHLFEGIDTKVLADRVYLSPFYFQRLFKRLVKRSVQNYIKMRRLAKAIERLKNTDKRLIDIANELGFSDHSNFTRIFKEMYIKSKLVLRESLEELIEESEWPSMNQ